MNAPFSLCMSKSEFGVYERDRNTGCFPSKPTRIDGLDQVLAIKALGLELPLRDLYRGVIA